MPRGSWIFAVIFCVPQDTLYIARPYKVENQIRGIVAPPPSPRYGARLCISRQGFSTLLAASIRVSRIYDARQPVPSRMLVSNSELPEVHADG